VSLTLLSAAVFNHHGTLQLALCHYVITLLLNMIDIVHIVPLRSVSASSKVLGPDIFYHILSLSPRSLASSCLSWPSEVKQAAVLLAGKTVEPLVVSSFSLHISRFFCKLIFILYIYVYAYMYTYIYICIGRLNKREQEIASVGSCSTKIKTQSAQPLLAVCLRWAVAEGISNQNIKVITFNVQPSLALPVLWPAHDVADLEKLPNT